MKYLFLSPHPDDAELACGGTMARLRREGHEVHVAVFSHCDIDLEEMHRSHATLGVETHYMDFPRREFPVHRAKILNWMLELRDMIHYPDVVFIPHISDVHQDHQTISREGERAFKMSSMLVGYTHPQNRMDGDDNYFVRLLPVDVSVKLRALDCYKSQYERLYFNRAKFRAVLEYNGIRCNSEYAESFRIIKRIDH